MIRGSGAFLASIAEVTVKNEFRKLNVEDKTKVLAYIPTCEGQVG